MIKIKQNYLTILELEFDDLKEDINILMDEDAHLRDDKKVSHYVFMENLATLSREIIELDAFSEILTSLDVKAYKDLDEMIEALKMEFLTIMKKYAMPAGVISYEWLLIF